MLKEIYAVAGGVGAFFIAVAMFVSFIGWWMAVTATVTRDMRSPLKSLLIVMVSLFPPLGVLLVSFFVYTDRRAVSEAISTMPHTGPLRPGIKRSVKLSSVQHAA